MKSPDFFYRIIIIGITIAASLSHAHSPAPPKLIYGRGEASCPNAKLCLYAHENYNLHNKDGEILIIDSGTQVGDFKRLFFNGDADNGVPRSIINNSNSEATLFSEHNFSGALLKLVAKEKKATLTHYSNKHIWGGALTQSASVGPKNTSCHFTKVDKKSNRTTK